MPRADLYRSADHESEVRQWCRDRLEAWPVPHRTTVVGTVLGDTHVTSLGAGSDLCVYLPGTNLNAATSTVLLEALATRCRVACADLPGQPGLSSATRPRDDDLAGRWLGAVLREVRGDPVGRVVLVAHSRGAAVALSTDPDAVDAAVLVSPAGLVGAHLSPGTVVPSVAWLLRPTDRRSARVVGLMAGPSSPTDLAALVPWMTRAARSTRTSGAPGPLPPPVLARWRGRHVRVLVGEHDVFFPPERLAGPVRDLLGQPLEVVAGAGHLLPDQRPDTLLAAVDEALA